MSTPAVSLIAPLACLIDLYRARWEIEMLLYVLKNGCKVEELHLGTIERVERALALDLVVGWRIAHLMRMGRTCPTWTSNCSPTRTKRRWRAWRQDHFERTARCPILA
jgi:hypothetical protein